MVLRSPASRAIVLAAVCGIGVVSAKSIQQTTPSPNAPPQASPSPAAPRVANAAPDAPVPDVGTLPKAAEKPKEAGGKIAKKLKDAAPICLDAVLHTCWARGGKAEGPPAPQNSEFAKDMEIGDFYFKHKNYYGAQLRYSAALDVNPNAPEAMFKLAWAFDRAQEKDWARCQYQWFLEVGTDLPFAEQARKALERLGPAKPGFKCPE